MQEFSLAKVPQVDLKLALDDLPLREEIKKATMHLKVGKSPGINAFQQKSISTGEKQCSISSRICPPTVGRKGLYGRTSGISHCLSVQKKGEKSVRLNYRGITLFCTAGKILAGVLLNRLIPTRTQENTPESQCGFTSIRGTTDMIFGLRQIPEKRHLDIGLYAAFVDLTKVFDTVSRDGFVENPRSPWLSPQISHHPPPAP